MTHVAARKRGGRPRVPELRAVPAHDRGGEHRVRAAGAAHARRARRERRKELLRLVALEGDERLPAQLSGGQQQRVAVARARSPTSPRCCCSMSPFGALDAKIREELRRTIRQVQRELGITTVLVTHDQEEAFAMADRIGITEPRAPARDGRPARPVLAPGARASSPPSSEAANLILARRTPDGVQMGGATVAAAERAEGTRENEVVAVVRPEEIEVGASREALRCGYLGRGASDRWRWCSTARWNACVRGPHRRASRRAAASPSATATDSNASLQVTRTQHEQRSFEVRPGQGGRHRRAPRACCRRPLSSFTACAPSETSPRLSHQPLLAELAARIRPASRRARSRSWACRRPLPGRGHVSSATVLAAYPDSAQRAEVTAAPRGAATRAGAARRGARRSACSSTGSARRRAAPRPPSPPACCGASAEAVTISVVRQRGPAEHARRTACASCWMRARRRRRRLDWRCAPSCTSGTRATARAAPRRRLPGRC